MLTKRNIKKMAVSHGMSYGVTILPGSPLFNNTQNLVDFANTLYAAGAKDMQERSKRVIECLLLDPYKEATAADALVAIKALETV